MSSSDWIIPIALCVPAIVLNLLLLIDSKSTFISNILEIKKVRNVFLVGIIQAAIYFTEYILHAYSFFSNRSLGMLTESVLYMSNLLYVIAFADLIFSKYLKEQYKRKINRVYFFIPIIVLFVLEFLNIFFLYFSIYRRIRLSMRKRMV